MWTVLTEDVWCCLRICLASIPDLGALFSFVSGLKQWDADTLTFNFPHCTLIWLPETFFITPSLSSVSIKTRCPTFNALGSIGSLFWWFLGIFSPSILFLAEEAILLTFPLSISAAFFFKSLIMISDWILRFRLMFSDSSLVLANMLSRLAVNLSLSSNSLSFKLPISFIWFWRLVRSFDNSLLWALSLAITSSMLFKGDIFFKSSALSIIPSGIPNLLQILKALLLPAIPITRW